MDVGAAGFEVIAVEDEVVGEASLPDGELRCDVAGESSLDEVHYLRDSFGVRGEEQVDVVWHDDEGVEFVCPFGAVVLEGFEEEVGVRGELEEAATIVGDGGDEECAGGGGSRRDGHGVSLLAGLAVVKEEKKRRGGGAFAARVNACPSDEWFAGIILREFFCCGGGF